MTYETVGVNTGTSEAKALVHGGSANIKPSTFTEIDASTSIDSDGFWVYCGVNTTSNADSLIDIATGAAGLEVILIADLLFSSGDIQGESNLIYVPISIASGTRLSARHQNRGTSGTVDVAIILTTDSGLDVTAFTACDTMGAVTSDSGGTQIDPGAVAHTKNSPYVEIVASTANTYKALIVAIGQIQNTSIAGAHFLFDVAIGASGSEIDFLSNLSFSGGSTSDTFQPKIFGPFACDIPSGLRLSVRGQSSTTNGVDRLFDVVLYGVH